MKTWKLVVEIDSCPEMGFPEDMPDQEVLELVEEALQDGGFDNDMSARVRLQAIEKEPKVWSYRSDAYPEKECRLCKEPGCAGC